MDYCFSLKRLTSSLVVCVLLVMTWQLRVVQTQDGCRPQSAPYQLGPHPDDCSKYLILCQVGGQEEKECPPGTVFNDMEKDCVTRLSDLDNCTSADAVRECRIGKVDLIPHPTACQRYFNCSDTSPRYFRSKFQPFENECTYPDVYDVNLRQCIHYENATCGNGSVFATWICDYLANQCTRSHCIPCSARNPSCVGKEDGLWPNPQKLWSPYYITCISERSENGEGVCSPDELMGQTRLFHPEERQCLPLWDIPVEHGGYKPSCDSKPPGFYESDSSNNITYHCPGEEKFFCRPPLSYNYNITLCTPLQPEIPETDPLCIGKEDGLWSNPVKLWSPYYFECQSQKVKNGEQWCIFEDLIPMTRLFHPEERQCLPLWDIPVEHGGYKPSCDSKSPGFYEVNNLEIVSYHCPGEEKFFCRPPLSYNYNITLCTPLQPEIPETDPLCIGKEDGLWSNPVKLWSPYYFECQSQKVKNGEQRCISEDLIQMTRLFHPEERQCLPLWDIPVEHGGYKPSCDSKSPGFYEADIINIISYHCPGEEKFLCRPPLLYHYNISLCTALQPEIPAADPLCIGKEDGLWPNPVKLWTPYYVECQSQKVKNGEEQCPEVMDVGQLFHLDVRKCIPLWEIPQEHGGFQSSCESKEPGLHSYDILAFRCPGEEKFLCRPPLYSDTDLRRCSPIGDQDQCPQSAPYKLGPHLDDCSKYLILCQVGGQEEKECPPGTVFNDVEKDCVTRLSDLDNCTSANAVRECRIGKVDLIPNPTACHLYFNCSDTSIRGIYTTLQSYENVCSYPDLYDVNLRECVHYDNATCGDGRVEAKWICDYDRSDCTRCTPCSVHNPSCVGKEDGLWPNPEKLWSPYYITCISERSKNGEEVCSPEELMGTSRLFHPEERQCLPLWDIPVEHGGYKPSCDSKPPGFYESDSSNNITYHCPGEEKFLCQPPLSYDYYITRCKPLQPEIPATDPLCIGKEDGLWSNPVKLWSPYYVECQSQKVKNGEQRCIPEDLIQMTRLFHPVERQCLPMWDIPVEHYGYKPSCDSKSPGFYETDRISIISYHCPGEEKFLCQPPLSYHYNITLCTPLQPDILAADPLCNGKEDGLWPNPAKLWTPYYVECQSQNVKNGEEQCPEVMGHDLIFHPEEHKCIRQVKCPESAPYQLGPHPDDCSKYLILCQVGGQEEKECPPGTVFNDVEKDCVTRLSDLDNCTSANAVRECRIGKVDLIPHPTACQRYFNCSDKSSRGSYRVFLPYENECTYPDVYETSLGECVHYKDATCERGRIAAKWICDYLASKCNYCSPCSLDNPSCIGKEDGNWPNPQKLWSPHYTTCVSERSQKGGERCNPEALSGTPRFFHAEERRCLPLWEIPVNHGGLKPRCDSKLPGFYEVNRADIVSYHCPGEEKFLCRPPLSYHYNITLCTPLQPEIPAADPFCIGKEDGLWPNPVKMWTPYYIECQSQNAKNGEERCSKVMDQFQLFHPEHRKCVPLTDVPRQHGGFMNGSGSKGITLASVVTNIICCVLIFST